MGASKRAGNTAASRKQQMPAGEKDPVNERPETERPRRVCLLKQLRKTKLCMYHLQGICQYGDGCAFAHSCNEVQHAPDLRKTRLCKAFAAGKCTRADCGFAHGSEELRSTDMFYKKTLCMWHEKGRCRNGDQCRFAHGVTELRNDEGDYMEMAKPSDYADFSGGMQLEPHVLGQRLQEGAMALAPPARMPAPKRAAAKGGFGGMTATSGMPSISAAQPSYVQPMFVQPQPMAPVPVVAPMGQTCLSNGAGAAAPEDVSLPLGMSALGAGLAGPGLEMPHAWPHSMGFAAPSISDVLAQEITRALESSQNKLSAVSRLNPGLSNHPEAKADLQQLSVNIQALSEQLSMFESQLHQHVGANKGMEEALPYLRKSHPFTSPFTDYLPVGHAFSPFELSSMSDPAMSAAMFEDQLNCMGG